MPENAMNGAISDGGSGRYKWQRQYISSFAVSGINEIRYVTFKLPVGDVFRCTIGLSPPPLPSTALLPLRQHAPAGGELWFQSRSIDRRKNPCAGVMSGKPSTADWASFHAVIRLHILLEPQLLVSASVRIYAHLTISPHKNRTAA